jgi:tRNA-dihydrouridine synthase B
MAIKPVNPFILAPMAGITDMPFRRLMRRMGAGCVISEFVSAAGIVQTEKKHGRYLSYHEDERPVGIQLFGDDAGILAEAAKIVEGKGLDFVDINLGCPVPKVTKKGGGSAWLTRENELGDLFRTVRSAIKVPLTIKIRTGWDSQNLNAHEVVRIAREEGVEWVAIHGRTRTQGYAGLADWPFIKEVAERAPLPIIGNGDLISGPLSAARLLESGCAGVMIGRGALKNPWIFEEANEALAGAEGLDSAGVAQFCRSIIDHHKLPHAGDIPEGRYYYERKVKRTQPKPWDATSDWTRIRADRDANALIQMHLGFLYEAYPEERVKFGFRKFLAWYSAGYPGSKEFRKFLFTHEDFDDLIARSLEFFESVKKLGVDESRDAEPVLMDGHG